MKRIILLALAGLSGCSDQPTMFSNPDPNLRMTRTQFKETARASFPYNESAPRAAEPKARAQVGYWLNRLEVVNFTGQDWKDVDVWVNRQYVCRVPVMESRKLKEIHFPMLYDAAGNQFPMDNNKILVERVELFREGTMYEIVVKPADF